MSHRIPGVRTWDGWLCSCGYFVGGHSSFTFRKSSALLSIGDSSLLLFPLGRVSWWMSQA